MTPEIVQYTTRIYNGVTWHWIRPLNPLHQKILRKNWNFRKKLWFLGQKWTISEKLYLWYLNSYARDFLHEPQQCFGVYVVMQDITRHCVYFIILLTKSGGTFCLSATFCPQRSPRFFIKLKFCLNHHIMASIGLNHFKNWFRLTY